MNRRTLFLIGLLLMLFALFGQFLPPLFLLKSGTEISLRTRPIDPFSIFRGQYVTLDYEIGTGSGRGLLDMDEPRRVYLTLEKKGDFYERVAVSDMIPSLKEGQVCIRGESRWGTTRFPDIGQYFVEEGMGKELESARNAHRLIVDAVVDDKCRAGIKGLRLGPEVPREEAEAAGIFMSPDMPPLREPNPNPNRVPSSRPVSPPSR
jgi:uncharacterized membrane-anchored protein